jgi:hypothetical protein
MEFRIDARKVAWSLFVVAVLLIAAHIGGMTSRYVLGHGQLFGLIDTFDVNIENNVPTFFSTFLLVTSAALLAVIAFQPAVAGREAAYWRWLCLIFLFLAVDEDASLHELLIDPMKVYLPLHGLLFFAWVVPYGLAVLFVGLLYLRFVLGLPARTRRLVIAAGSLYLAGVIGFELIGGWYLSEYGESENMPYSLLVAGEEFLEMSGVILFIYALLDYLADQLQGGPLRIHIRSR